MKQTKASRLKDGELFKRTEKSRVWFRVITRIPGKVVATSMRSDFSILVKNSQKVFKSGEFRPEPV